MCFWNLFGKYLWPRERRTHRGIVGRLRHHTIHANTNLARIQNNNIICERRRNVHERDNGNEVDIVEKWWWYPPPSHIVVLKKIMWWLCAVYDKPFVIFLLKFAKHSIRRLYRRLYLGCCVIVLFERPAKKKRIKIIIFKNVRFCLLFEIFVVYTDWSGSIVQIIFLLYHASIVEWKTMTSKTETMSGDFFFAFAWTKERKRKRNNQKVFLLCSLWVATLGQMNVMAKVMTNSNFIAYWIYINLIFFIFPYEKYDIFHDDVFCTVAVVMTSKCVGFVRIRIHSSNKELQQKNLDVGCVTVQWCSHTTLVLLQYV